MVCSTTAVQAESHVIDAAATRSVSRLVRVKKDRRRITERGFVVTVQGRVDEGRETRARENSLGGMGRGAIGEEIDLYWGWGWREESSTRIRV
jgi:hypothetical protein